MVASCRAVLCTLHECNAHDVVVTDFCVILAAARRAFAILADGAWLADDSPWWLFWNANTCMVESSLCALRFTSGFRATEPGLCTCSERGQGMRGPPGMRALPSAGAARSRRRTAGQPHSEALHRCACRHWFTVYPCKCSRLSCWNSLIRSHAPAGEQEGGH